MIRFTITFFLFHLIHLLAAQEVIQAGKMYQSGDQLYVPLSGISMTIPPHWRGYGTRETEMLTLNSDTSNATLRIFVVQDNLVSMKSALPKGIVLGPDVEIKTKGEITFEENMLSAELYMSNDPNISGYYLAKCGEFGNCVGFLLSTQSKTHTRYFNGLKQLMLDLKLEKPSISAVGADYNWAKELTNKYIFHYESNRTGTLGNQIWLCPDGSFTAKIKRKGMFNQGQQKKIKGNYSGKYRIEGTGLEGVLILSFPKLNGEERIFKTNLINEEVYIEGIIYYMAINTKCN